SRCTSAGDGGRGGWALGSVFRVFCHMMTLGIAERGNTCPFGVIFVTHGEACDTGGTGGAGSPATAPERAAATPLPGRRMALPDRRTGVRRGRRVHGVD